MRLFKQVGSINMIRPNSRIVYRCLRSFTSNTPPEPPLVVRIRSDIKDAMRKWEKNRLNVLRGLLADIVNSSKINRAITHDHQVVSLLRSRIKLSERAAVEFAAAERDDLKAKEEEQVSILQSYLEGLETISDEDIKIAALEALDVLRTQGKKIHMGAIIKALIGADGRFYGKYLDMPSVTRIVREVVFSGKTEDSQNLIA